MLRPEGEAIDFLCKCNGAVLLVDEKQVFASATEVFCILFVFVIEVPFILWLRNKKILNSIAWKNY